MVRGRDRSEATQTLFYFQILFKFVFNSISIYFQKFLKYIFPMKIFYALGDSVSSHGITQWYVRPNFILFPNTFQICFNSISIYFQKFLKIYFPMMVTFTFPRDPPHPRTPPQVGWGPTHHRESHTIYTTHQVGNRYAQVESSWAWEACAL
jgi:hypothetical protein